MTEEKKEEALEKVKGQEEDFLAMDQWDEKAIVDELRGEVMEEFVYRIPRGNSQVVGLTWAGTKEIARQMALRGQTITLGKPEVIETSEKYTIMMKATNLYTKAEMYGGAVGKMKDIYGKDDPFAFQKTLSKAQRNAIRTLIPEKFAAIFIDQQIKETKKVKDIKPVKKEEPSSNGWKGEFESGDKVGEMPPRKATEKQVACIRAKVKGLGLEEASICKQNGVGKLEDLLLPQASEVIEELGIVEKEKGGSG
jgi:hypothetical protein